MGSLRGHNKEEFWKGADARIRAIGRAKAEIWDASVVEVGTGGNVGKVKVLLPGEITPTTDLPFAPVVGPMPLVGDQVTVVADAASRRVITGDDNLLFADPTISNAATGTTMQPSHYYNISAAGASPTLASGNVDPTSVIVIRSIVACTVNAAAGETVNGTLTSFAMPAYSSVILTARGTTGWAVISSSGVPAFAAPDPRMVIGQKTSDESFASAAVANVTDMVFPVGAGERWNYEFNIWYRATSAADIRFDLVPPAGAGSRIYTLLRVPTTNTVLPSAAEFGTVALNGSFLLNAGGTGVTSGSETLVILKGVITVGATAGTMQLRAAQLVADAANPSVVTQFSNFVAFRA